MSDDKIKIGVDGPGVTPETVDPLEALHVATAYFELIQKIASYLDLPLEMRGLEVEGGSAGLSARTGDRKLSRAVEERAYSYVTGQARPPDPVRPNVDEVKRVLRALPNDHVAKIYDITAGRPLLPADFQLPGRPAELTTVRALLISIGGKTPKAKFQSDLENDGAPFSLHVTEGMARSLGTHLYSSLEISMEVERNSDGKIEGGTLLEHEPVQEGNALEAWRTWHRQNASDWDQVEDIEEELGRDRH